MWLILKSCVVQKEGEGPRPGRQQSWRGRLLVKRVLYGFFEEGSGGRIKALEAQRKPWRFYCRMELPTVPRSEKAVCVNTRNRIGQFFGVSPVLGESQPAPTKDPISNSARPPKFESHCNCRDILRKFAFTRTHHGLRNTKPPLGGHCPRHQRDQDPARHQPRWRELPSRDGREVDQDPRGPCLPGQQVPDNQRQHWHRLSRPHAPRPGEARRLESCHCLQGRPSQYDPGSHAPPLYRRR